MSVDYCELTALDRLMILMDMDPTWDALPEHIRKKITTCHRSDCVGGCLGPDLVRGVRMLAEETRTCDVCGATGELDSRCGRCIR